MKFELVEPGPEPEPHPERTDRAPGGTDPVQSASIDDSARLRIAMERMTSQVKESGARIGPSLARLAAAMEAHRSDTADSGHEAPVPPTDFEGSRFRGRAKGGHSDRQE